MEYLIPSLLAGGLTILAPCTITLLPIILSGTVGEKNPWRPVVVSLSLSISIILFTLLLKATTSLIVIPEAFWKYLSGGLIIFFGLTMLFPHAWETLAFHLKLYKSQNLLTGSSEKRGLKGSILLGASLGPVFSTCSPTYALLLAIVLPQNLAIGTLNLIVFSLGLAIPLTLIGYGGQKVAGYFRAAANPHGWLKRILATILLFTGLSILTGFDKTLESAILDTGYLGPIGIENKLLDK